MGLLAFKEIIFNMGKDRCLSVDAGAEVWEPCRLSLAGGECRNWHGPV